MPSNSIQKHTGDLSALLSRKHRHSAMLSRTFLPRACALLALFMLCVPLQGASGATNLNIVPFGATMSTAALRLGDCPEAFEGSPTAWAYPDWGQCWSATVTATKSIGYLDSAEAYSTQLSLTDGRVS